MPKSTILHICNDYSYSKVYKNLYKQFDDLDYPQIIFHPLRSKKNIGKNVFEFKTEGSKVLYSNLLKKYHRILFRLKINTLYRDLLKQIEPGNIDISNATTLFSDGALSYKLKKDFNIPYIVTARHTDVNLFLKYRPDLIPLALKILNNAEKIIFISPVLKEQFFKHSKIKEHKINFLSKSCVILNGIDDFWLKNLNTENRTKENKFLYVGVFNKNKNVVRLIKALTKLKIEFPNITLSLVGGGGDEHKEVLDLVNMNDSWIRYYGSVHNKTELLDIYRSHKFFVMTSIYETFGLVYIEALSQGLPVTYTNNQGIDGLFNIKIGERANAKDIEDISKKLAQMINDYSNYQMEKIDFDDFSWEKIVLKYDAIFTEIGQKIIVNSPNSTFSFENKH